MKGGGVMLQILSVDDDESVLDINVSYLSKHDCQIYPAKSAKEARELLSSVSFDCILLDILLEDEDGFRFCQEIKQYCSTPIICLTNLTEEEHLLKGFDCGADDYMVKPYSLSELYARILARTKQNQQTLHYPPLTINLDQRIVSINDKLVPLTDSEFAILKFLAFHPNQPFSQRELYERIWKLPFLKKNHTVQVHIVQLRKKLEEVYPEHCYIQTKWGEGYFFTSA